MKLTIISVGKLKQKYLQLGINEYSKRLSRYTKLELIEVQDEKVPDIMSITEKNIILKKECQKILPYLKNNMYIIALVIDGNQLSSVQLSSFIQNKMVNGINNIVFIIGGSIGLSEEIINRADYKLSFSNMTFPHQLMKLILLEQIYRAYKIINNEVYHK